MAATLASRKRRRSSSVFGPLRPAASGSDGHTLVVTDHGRGFPSQKEWDDYLRVGESSSASRDELFGVNGLGKFAPLFFADSFTVRTCPNSGTDVIVVHIEKDRIFSGDFKTYLGRRGDLPTDPEEGSFTSIIIEGMEEPYDPTQIMEELTNELAIEPRTITVNNALVPPRKTIGDAVKLSTGRAMPKIGIVSCEVGVTERSIRSDSIRLLGGGREICSLNELPPAYRRQLAPIFFHPHLFGWINVERWAKRSTIAKDRLRADAMSRAEWTSFIRALELFFRKPFERAVEQLDLGVSSPDRMISTLRSLTTTFQAKWPVDPKLAAEFGFGIGTADGKEDKVPGTRGPNKGAKPGSVEGTGKGTPKGTTGKPGIGTGTRTTSAPTFLIRIQDTVYRLWPINSAEAWPAYVGRGNMIFLAVNNLRYQLVRRRGIKAELTFLEQVVVEAHVREKRPGDGPAVFLSEVHQLLSTLNP